jgi:hypothetical protein
LEIAVLAGPLLSLLPPHPVNTAAAASTNITLVAILITQLLSLFSNMAVTFLQ